MTSQRDPDPRCLQEPAESERHSVRVSSPPSHPRGAGVSYSFPAPSQEDHRISSRAGSPSRGLPAPTLQTLGVWIFSTFFKQLFWETIFLQSWTKDERVSACRCERGGQPGVCPEACAAPGQSVLFREWREGAAAGAASLGTLPERPSILGIFPVGFGELTPTRTSCGRGPSGCGDSDFQPRSENRR